MGLARGGDRPVMQPTKKTAWPNAPVPPAVLLLEDGSPMQLEDNAYVILES